MRFYIGARRNILRLVISCFVGFTSQTTFAAADLTYRIERFTPYAHYLMQDHGVNQVFKVLVNDVRDYLPQREKIKRTGVKLVAKGVLPGKCIISLIRHSILEPNDIVRSQSAKMFFGGLPENTPHTYALLENELIFTQTTAIPLRERYKDRFSKHFLISGMQKKVYFAGEFSVIKDKNTREVFVIFDNASGTYRPKSEHLPNFQKLMEANFKEDGLHLLTRSFGQKIDRAQLLLEKKIPTQN